jgi:hypothetical protein
MKYSWNIRLWIEKTLPWFMAMPTRIAWLYVLLKPLENIHARFTSLNTDLDLKVKYSSQQLLFAAVLNKIFDNGLKRIRVQTDSDSLPVIYVKFKAEDVVPQLYSYLKSEAKPVKYIYNKSEYDNTAGFTVYVPNSLSGIEPRIRGWIDYYKLAEKTYTIIYE